MNCKELIEDDQEVDEVEYSIELLERVEDWYTGEIHFDDFTCTDNLSQSLAVFEKYCLKLITTDISTTELDEAIVYHFSEEIEYDECDISNWSMGYLLSLNRDGETFISIFFNYDFKTKLIADTDIVEFDKDELGAFDLSNLFKRLKITM